MLVVAIDHATALTEALRRWKIVMSEEEARLRIAQRSVEAGANGAVLNYLAYSIGTTRAGLMDKAWLGGPDVGLSEMLSTAQRLSRQALRAGASSILLKIGLRITDDDGIDCLADVARSLDSIVGVGAELIVVEPEFDDSVTIKRRASVVAALAQGGPQLHFKCDYGPGERWLAALGSEVKGRWYLRSSGATFGSFAQMLTLAMRHGCQGAIVGTALWSDIGGGMISGDSETLDVLAERVRTIGDIWRDRA